MKKLLLLVMLTCITTLSTFAYDACINGIYYNLDSYSNSKTAEVTCKVYAEIRSEEEITPPANAYVIENYEDPDDWVWKCQYCISDYTGYVTIPSTVSYGGNEYTVTSIDNYAFVNCSSLSYVSIPSSVTSIGANAFYGCTKISSVSIPSSVTTIGSKAFYGCSGVSSINIPSSVTTIWKDAFTGCTGTLTVNSSAALYWSSEYYDDEYQDPYFTVPYFPLANSSFSKIIIGESITRLEDYQDDRSGRGTKEHSVFANCKKLISISFPSTLNYIGSYAFSGCTSLSTVSIPSSVTGIGSNAFYGCTSLKGITCRATTPPSCGSSVFNKVSNTIPVYIPSGCKSAYQTASEWKAFSNLTELTYTNKCGDNLVWAIDDNGTLTISGTGDMNNYSGFTTPWYSIRSSIKKIVISEGATSIGEDAFSFYDCTGPTSVTIPNSVTSIGENAFRSCTGLTSIDIPNSVTSIGDKAFCGCSGLTSVTIPNSVTSIGEGAFASCTGIISATLSNNLPNISNGLFQECSNLASVNMPNSIKFISHYAFFGCTSLTSIDIPSSVQTIGNFSFGSCSGLTSITLPASITELFDKSFVNCTGLSSITCWAQTPPICGTSTFLNVINSIPLIVNKKYIEKYQNAEVWKDFTNIQAAAEYIVASGTCGDNLSWKLNDDGILSISGTGAMYDFSSASAVPWSSYRSTITTLSLSDDITSIGDYAFYHCYKLTSVTIPNSVTSIGDNAFWYCSSITSITIPNSVTSIGQSAFDYCTDLTSVNISDLAAWCNIKFGDLRANPLYYAHKLYLNGEEIKDLVIPNSVTSIGSCAFYYCKGLTSVTIPNSVTSIGDYAFVECTDLTSVTIPNSVTSIGDEAFVGCTGLTSIEIPNSVTSIGTSAFNGCTGLTSVTIPNSVTSIGNYTFSGCTGLTSITCEAVTPPTCESSAFNHVSKDIPVYVPASSVEAYKSAEVWKDFTNIQSIKEVYNILDTETSFAQSTEYQYDELTYTRKFGSTNYQCLYIPMTVNVADLPTGLEVYKISAIYMFDNDGDGEYDETTLRIARIKSDILKANHPYFIKASVSGEYTIPSYDNILYKSELSENSCSTMDLTSTFYGNYEKHAIGQDFYTLSSGIVKNMLSTVSLGAFRWYMLVSDRDGQTIKLPDSAAKIRIVVDGGDSATGIDETIANESAQKVVEGYYTLDGHKNDAPTSGVNIIKYTDGTSKKVFINK